MQERSVLLQPVGEELLIELLMTDQNRSTDVLKTFWTKEIPIVNGFFLQIKF